jgi:hypothetical protein
MLWHAPQQKLLEPSGGSVTCKHEGSDKEESNSRGRDNSDVPHLSIRRTFP